VAVRNPRYICSLPACLLIDACGRQHVCPRWVDALRRAAWRGWRLARCVHRLTFHVREPPTRTKAAVSIEKSPCSRGDCTRPHDISALRQVARDLWQRQVSATLAEQQCHSSDQPGHVQKPHPRLQAGQDMRHCVDFAVFTETNTPAFVTLACYEIDQNEINQSNQPTSKALLS
jgi:hypothetical protein